MNFSNIRYIKKAYTEGIYSDNSQNRKLGRVGMTYGHNINLEGFEKEDNENSFIVNPKLILKRAKILLHQRPFQLVKDLIESDDFREGDIFIDKGKFYFVSNIEINPERDKDIINLGKREEVKSREEGEYYKFIRKNWAPKRLEEKWFNTFEKEESWGKYKHNSMLARLKMEYEQRQSALNEAKYSLSYKWYKEGKTEGEDIDPLEISDYEAEKYIKIYGNKYDKENFMYNSKHKSFIEALINYGIDFEQIDRDNIDDNFKEKFKEYIISSPRNDFYQMVKGCSEDSSYMNDLIKLRFAFKYNKMLAGQGWGDILKEDGKIDINKRDEVLELCKQLEYAVDEVLGENKDLFVNNSNIDFIRFDDGVEWGGASYNKKDKVITITNKYFQSIKENRKKDREAGTLAREKFMVEGFIHEIGHSLDITSDVYNSEAYKDFAIHLGYDKNRLYTIYTNAIKEDTELFNNQDYYLNIEKDKKGELVKKFGPLYETYLGGNSKSKFNDEELGELFLSKYSVKSVTEGFSEYFSFYMGNRKYLDKQIIEYKKDPKKYLSEVNISNWYKYSVYGGKWKSLFNSDLRNSKDFKENKAFRKYYETVVEHNLEMLEDIQQIVKIAKKDMKTK